MALETVLVYQIATGDTTYQHFGYFTVTVAGSLTIDDSDGIDDAVFGDLTGTGSGDVSDQDVTESTVDGINIGDTVDVRYKYYVTGSDGSSGYVYFIATNGGSNYGMLMVSDFPLDPLVTYTFVSATTDAGVNYDDLVPCFCKGTQIETANGAVSVEGLQVGDMVRTMDSGYQSIRWVGSKSLDAIDLTVRPKLRPVRIGKGALGPNIPKCDLLVSPQHRILVRSRIAQRMFGTKEVLIPAIKLLGLPGVSQDRQAVRVTYFHMLFDTHQIVFSAGVATESLYTGPMALKAVGQQAYLEITALFPQIAAQDYLPALARPVPAKGKRMRRLVERHARNGQPVQ